MKARVPWNVVFATAAIVAAAVVSGLEARHGTSPTAQLYDVYVDAPTGYAFINTPTSGWKFIRQLDEAQMANLPVGTLLTQARPSHVQPGQYALMVDEKTGYAFVKSSGNQWTFVRKLSPEQVASVDAGTIVTQAPESALAQARATLMTGTTALAPSSQR